MEIPTKMLQVCKIASPPKSPFNKYNMNNIKVSLGESIIVEATDGKRYITAEDKVTPSEEQPFSFVVDKRTAKHLTNNKQEHVAVKEKKKLVEILQNYGKIIISKKEDDKFPHEVNKLVPTSQPITSVTVDARLLAELLTIIADISKGGTATNNNVVISIFEPGRPVKLESENGKFKTTAILMPLNKRQ